MRAITVVPGDPAGAELSDLPEPEAGPGDLLVEPMLLGVCGTDREIVGGVHGEAPEGEERLVLGHELLARVRTAADGSGGARGRSRRRHCPAARPGALRVLRSWRVGHVSQRSLRKADRSWLERLITRPVPLERWQDALDKAEDDNKTVIEFPAGASAGRDG
jgi:hypothetical protein